MAETNQPASVGKNGHKDALCVRASCENNFTFDATTTGVQISIVAVCAHGAWIEVRRLEPYVSSQTKILKKHMRRTGLVASLRSGQVPSSGRQQLGAMVLDVLGQAQISCQRQTTSI